MERLFNNPKSPDRTLIDRNFLICILKNKILSDSDINIYEPSDNSLAELDFLDGSIITIFIEEPIEYYTNVKVGD